MLKFFWLSYSVVAKFVIQIFLWMIATSSISQSWKKPTDCIGISYIMVKELPNKAVTHVVVTKSKSIGWIHYCGRNMFNYKSSICLRIFYIWMHFVCHTWTPYIILWRLMYGSLLPWVHKSLHSIYNLHWTYNLWNWKHNKLGRKGNQLYFVRER